MQRVKANVVVSVSELKKNPSRIVSMSDGEAVAVLNHNRVIAYMVPAARYEAMMEHIGDLEQTKIIKKRQHENPVQIDLDDL